MDTRSRRGTWYIESKKDPRWNCSGRFVKGCFSVSNECKNKIAELTKILGDPPQDLKSKYISQIPRAKATGLVALGRGSNSNVRRKS